MNEEPVEVKDEQVIIIEEPRVNIKPHVISNEEIPKTEQTDLN